MPIPKGERAPEFTLPRWKDVEFRLADAKLPLILAFFKTTCPTCRVAMPYLQRLNDTYPSLPMYAVSESTQEENEAFCAEYLIRLPILQEAKPWPVSASYGLVAVPTVFLLGKERTVEHVLEGWSRAGINDLSARAATIVHAKPVVLSTPDDGAPEWKPG